MKRLALIAALILAALFTTAPAFAATSGVSADHSQGIVLIGSGTANCNAGNTGGVRYNSTNPGLEYCNGTGWVNTGLYSRVLSPTPTQSSTGLTNWYNQGSMSAANTSLGITITTGATPAGLLYKAAPATPYSFTGFFNAIGGCVAEFGWMDSATGKSQLMDMVGSGGASSNAGFLVLNFDALLSYNTYVALESGRPSAYPIWFRIRNDGTTVYFQDGDGVNWSTVYSVAKSSGWLGSSGYNRVAVGGGPSGGGGGAANDCSLTIMSWSQGT